MGQEVDSMLSMQPLRILQLFPVRKTTSLEFDLIKYKKLYEALSCTFCRQIFNNPTYLKCSHRFCKQCIQTHVRINDKKSCPLCRGELTTKRDSKFDLKLISLINFAFGDAVGFQKKINAFEDQSYKKYVEEKKARDQQLKQSKRQRPQILESKSKAEETLSRKRSRKAQPQQQQQMKQISVKNISTQIISEQPTTQKQKIKPKLIKQDEKSNEQQIKFNIESASSHNWKNTRNKQKSRKKPQIIQINSSQQIAVNKNTCIKQEIASERPKSDFQLRQNRLPPSKSSQKSAQKQKQMIAEPSTNLRNALQIINKQQQRRLFQLNYFQNNNIQNEIIKSREYLQKQLKQSYIKTIIQRSQIPCTITLVLRRLPNFSLTPPLNISEITISLKTKIFNLKKFLLCKLKYSQQYNNIISLYVLSFQNKTYKLNEQNITILDLLQKYWKQYKGINLCNIVQVINKNINKEDNQGQKLKSNLNPNQNKRIIYYSMNVSKR